MSFLDNIKSRMKGDTSAEEQFQRGLREGSWPEGVDDFQLMGNTGTFLPATPDSDPREQADAFASKDSSQQDDRGDWSVVRAAGSTRAENRFTVIEGAAGVRPLAGSSQAQRPADDEMRVTPRSEGQVREKSSAGAQKSYAERLRERVASADVAPKEEPKMQVKSPARPAPAKPAVPEKPAAAPAPAAPAAPAPTKSAASRPAQQDAPTFSSDAVIVRTRTYDDVRKIASGLLSDHRPVVLAMRGTSDASCQRILDFSFGMCCASGASMSELGQKVYAICPKGVTVSEATMADLKRQGILR